MYSFNSSLVIVDNNIKEIVLLQSKLREFVISKKLKNRKKHKNSVNRPSSKVSYVSNSPISVTTTPFEKNKPASEFVTFRERYENQLNHSPEKPVSKISRKSFAIPKYISNLLPNKFSGFMIRIFTRVTNKFKDFRKKASPLE
jgi:hypothetical protein